MGKRRLCNHCNEYVDARTYRLHHSLYFDKSNKKWHISGQSSDEETSDENIAQDVASLPLGDDFSDRETTDTRADSRTKDAVRGAVVDDLEDEDIQLARENANDSMEDERLYMEKSGPEINLEMWDINEEDLNSDFVEMQDGQSSGLFHEQNTQDEKLKQIIKWTLVFLCMWSSYCCVSDNALDILIHFMNAVFQSIGTVFCLKKRTLHVRGL